MWVKSEPERERFLFEKIFLPMGTYAMSFMTWLWVIEPGSFESPHLSLIWLVALAVFSYETGFKSFCIRQRAKYFYLVFIFPTIISVLGVTGGYVYGVA
jgi:hypothetical protein